MGLVAWRGIAMGPVLWRGYSNGSSCMELI